MDKIREAQKADKEVASIKERMSKGKAKGFREDEHDTLWFDVTPRDRCARCRSVIR